MQNIGLDVGKNHIGWCVVNEDYKILHKKGKDLIGVNLFDEAETAENRRLARSSRRLNDRTQERVSFLTDIFKKPLCEVDPQFLTRIKESGLYEEDKSVSNQLFGSKESNIAFQKEYPTIFHLRNALMDTPETDVRKIYLVLLHMMKNRGHFNLKGVNISNATSFQYAYKLTRTALAECDIDLPKDTETVIQLEKTLKDMRLGKREKQATLKKILGITAKHKSHIAIVALLTGANSDLKNIFPEELEFYEENTKVNLASENVEEIIKAASLCLGNKKADAILSLKTLYDWSVLENILKGQRTYSAAQVSRYKKHKEDLMFLKETLIACRYEGSKNNVFYEVLKRDKFKKESLVDNYKAYIGKVYITDKKRRYSCTKEAFYTYLKKVFSTMKEENPELLDSVMVRDMSLTEAIEKILFEIEIMDFLPKQRSTDNRVIPNQMVVYEAEEVMKMSAKAMPFLNEQYGDSGITKAEAIKQMLSFTIPYYIGPINDSDKFAWAVHKEAGKVYPWNFEQKIDLKKSREKFMESCINDCCLMVEEKVLPDASFYIRKMESLNELNGITVDGEKLPLEVKQQAFNELTMRYEKVTLSGFKKFLEEKNIGNEDSIITGFTKKKLNHSMAPYLKLKNLLLMENMPLDLYETIVLDIVVCGQDKELLSMSLKDETNLSNEQISLVVSRFQVDGWSEYSKESIVNTQGQSTNDSVKGSIIDVLYSTNNRLSTILSAEYSFMDIFAEKNAGTIKGGTQEKIQNINTTPQTKRAISQMFAVGKDLKKFLKSEPDNIYLNIAVPNMMNNGKRASRKVQLLHMFKECGDTEWYQRVLAEENDISLRKFLYYTQKGRSMYTGKEIPYAEVMEKDYNIDHIYPKSLVYDNTDSNLVLVETTVNEYKSAEYPLSEAIQNKMLNFWTGLLENGLITVRKYDALCSKTCIPDDIKILSIEKILVEKRKTALAAGTILKRLFPHSEIIYVTNVLVNDFKKKYEINFNTTANEFIYAKNAYLSVIVGSVWFESFTKTPIRFIKEHNKYTLNVFNHSHGSWIAEEDKSIKAVLANIGEAHYMQSVMATSNDTGKLYDATILGKEYMQNTKARVAGRGKNFSNTNKYGGYGSLATAYFALVKSQKKDGTATTLEAIPTVLAEKIKNNPKMLVDFLEKEGLQNPEIICSRILLKTPIYVNGYKMYISGKTSDCIVINNGVPIYLDQASEKYLCAIEKYTEVSKKYKNVSPLKYEIDKSDNLQCYDNLLQIHRKLYHLRPNNGTDKLEEKKDLFKNLTVEEQVKVLYNMYLLTLRKKGAADLTLLGLSSNFGIAKINKDISSQNSVQICFESATALFTKRTSVV